MSKRPLNDLVTPPPIMDPTSINTSSGEEESDDEVSEEKVKKNNGPLTKKQKKQLSAQEVQVARETAELFKSNIFKLQIDELMKEIKTKDSHISKIEQVLHRLHELIMHVEASEQLSLGQAESLFKSKQVDIPFCDPKPTKTNYSFGYLPPKDISLVGSFGLKTGISPHAFSQDTATSSAIDVALTMPDSLFLAKDYLNYRAIHKRAFYIAYLADALIPLTKKHNLPVKISYHFLDGDILCPVLKLESIKTDTPEDLIFHKTKFTINIVAAFPFGIFDAKKLLPDKNCIRVQSDSPDTPLPPTPVYNASILLSSSYEYYLKYLYTAKKTADAFRDACILGRLWLRQRGFGSSMNKGGFGHFEFAMLMLALLNGGGVGGNKILLNGFSSYQLFKGTVKYLATMDLSAGYLSFSSLVGERSTSKYNDEGFNVPTVFDKNVKLNILWKMSMSSYENLRVHAQETLGLLNDVVKDRFDAILLQKSDFDRLRYDVVLTFDIPPSLLDNFGPLEKISFITLDNYLKHKIYMVLKYALGPRLKTIHVRAGRTYDSFAINRRKPSHHVDSMIICLLLNADECDKLVTKGPSNDDLVNGTKFRLFWGERATLRRFKDGSIQHCVVWSTQNGEPVVIPIVKYALDNHVHGGISDHVNSEGARFASILPVPLLPSALTLVASSLSSFTALKKSFDGLGRVLGNLESPLSIKALLPASTALRYSSLLQPVPFAVASPDFWNDAILQFETSTRWPDEILALEKTKTALLLKLQENLARELAYESSIARDEAIPYNYDVCVLKILTPEGFGFRIRVLTERDEALYLRAVSNSEKQKSIVQDTYLKFNQRYLGSVKHTRTMALLATHFPFYSASVRIFKFWLDSHLLLEHFPTELVELIAMKPFVDPAPYECPHSVENGFLQILNFVAQWNWKDDPLILDLTKSEEEESLVSAASTSSTEKHSDKLTVGTHRLIEANFERIRKTDPSGIKTQLFVGSKDDISGILWSNDLTLPIATRLTALARAAMQLFRGEGGFSAENIDLVFTPALNDYDFVINLKAATLTTWSGTILPGTFKNLAQPLNGFPQDPDAHGDFVNVYAADLKRHFGTSVIFSAKAYNGGASDGTCAIGGIFVPSGLARKKFRPNLVLDSKPIEESEEEVELNRESLFAQIRILGGDLVDSITIN